MKHQLRSSMSTEGRRMAGARALWVANGMKREMMGKPIIAIVNSFTQFVPGHTHLHEIGQLVKAEIEKLGCYAAEFNTIAIDDGIAMGHDGMLYSLPSRDLIADCVQEKGQLLYLPNTLKFIVTYLIKNKHFMQKKRVRDLERAQKLITKKLLKHSDLKKTDDITRYIKVTNTTADGIEATHSSYELDLEEAQHQALFDGFYAVSTSYDMEDKSAEPRSKKLPKYMAKEPFSNRKAIR